VDGLDVRPEPSRVMTADQSYRCTIGMSMDDDEQWHDKTFASFGAARRWMLEQLAVFLDDECLDCREMGTRAFVDLALARPSMADWHAEVDGNDYTIRSPKPAS